jgi:hypothetical protein
MANWEGGGCGESGDGFEDLVEVGSGVDFGLVPDDFAIFDEEGLPGREADAHGWDAEGFDDLAF